MKHLFIFISILFLHSCKTSVEERNEIPSAKGVIAEHAMVVSARIEASTIAADIMKKGGNAFDAMVATEMSLAVAYPFAGSLGGGGFMVYRMADGTTGSLDFREKAPLAASKNMYLDENGKFISEKSQLGGLAVGVPGTVAGIFAAHKRFGKLPMSEILKPVIELAKYGYVLSESQANSLNSNQINFSAVNNSNILYKGNFKAGDTIKNLSLSKTLEKIAQNGRDEYYGGETGKKVVKFIQENGGIITIEDLKKYEAVWRDPVIFNYKNLKIISMAPPSSGGIVMGEIFKMIEPFPLKEFGHNSVKYIQVLTEAERRAYADRSFYLGDPDFTQIPTAKLLSESYNHSRMENFSFDNPTASMDIDHGVIPGYESMETTHYSIVDTFGNAIAVTSTLNGAYGSKLYIEELGFFLNNEMDDFSSKPGVPNMFGLVGAEANAIEPQKRMLSSMTPTIVEQGGNLYMTLGTPGGSTIITSVLQTILNVSEFNMSMQEAINAGRFHHQWLPDSIMIEPNKFNNNTLESLINKGYNLNIKNAQIIGNVDGILKTKEGNLEGGADKRGDDAAVGF